MRLDWWAVVVGVAVAAAVSLALGAGLPAVGLIEARAVLPLASFLALAVGGYVAGRMSRKAASLHGALVAVFFIAVTAVLKWVAEARMVEQYGLLALPRMNMAGLFLGDILQLSAATLGGWLAARQQG